MGMESIATLKLECVGPFELPDALEPLELKSASEVVMEYWICRFQKGPSAQVREVLVIEPYSGWTVPIANSSRCARSKSALLP